MKILVPVKRVMDVNTRVRVRPDGSGIDTAGARFALNPFDEIAMEQAARLREAGTATDVLAVTIGDQDDVLRTALAMGADRALRVATDVDIQPLAAARTLAALVAREAPDLVLMGKQATDDDANQTGQMLAGLLDWAQGTFAARLDVSDNHVRIGRETDAGVEVLDLALPAVITCDLRLVVPRYPSLPNLMKAKRKPIDTVTPEDLGVDVTPRLTTLSVAEPPARRAGVRVDSVEDLVARLRSEADLLP